MASDFVLLLLSISISIFQPYFKNFRILLWMSSPPSLTSPLLLPGTVPWLVSVTTTAGSLPTLAFLYLKLSGWIHRPEWLTAALIKVCSILITVPYLAQPTRGHQNRKLPLNDANSKHYRKSLCSIKIIYKVQSSFNESFLCKAIIFYQKVNINICICLLVYTCKNMYWLAYLGHLYPRNAFH